MRLEVKQFVNLGPLPASNAEEDDIAAHESALHRIRPPVSFEEAEALSTCFGPDECFGLAWTLLHLIETAPKSPFLGEPPITENEWVKRLWDRAQTGRART